MLKKGSLTFVLLLLISACLASCAPSGEAEIEMPIVVNRVDMQVTKVDMKDSLLGGLEVLPGETHYSYNNHTR